MPDGGATCLNCGQAAGPHFCGNCGQPLHDRRLAFRSAVREIVEESFAIDGRAVRTFRALLHPGRVTRLYLEGKRIAFLGSFRLYLTASVLVFSSLLALRPPMPVRSISMWPANR